MKAISVIGALLILSLLTVLPSGIGQAKDQSTRQGVSGETAKPLGLYTQTESQKAGMEFETGNEFPMRVPGIHEGAHLLRPHDRHFLSVEKQSERRQMEASIRHQDEIAGKSF
jgi:hypothetical protein